ncbi:MAG: hypothetical protein U5L45_19555 [Saprospiraceae bacterium]|nr:hypothetical protein [Saprospiraceae bacterium]
MKSLPVICFFFFLATTLIAQEPLSARGDKYFFIGVSLPLSKVRDQAHSPQIYQGLTPTFSIGHDRVGQNIAARFAFSYTLSLAGLRPKTRPKPERQLSSADMNVLHFLGGVYKRVGNYDKDGWNRYVGGALTFTFDSRLYNLPSNNLFGYQVNTSLNVAGLVQKQLDNAWRFNYEGVVPIVSYALRPNHLGMPPMTTGDFSANIKRMATSGKVVTVNKLFRLYNRFSFEQQINDHRKRRYTYAWEASVNKISQPLNSVVAGLGYESLFKM